jgi:hypothetical protein
LEIQDGFRPPNWISKKWCNSGTDRPIYTKFEIHKQKATHELRFTSQFALWGIQDDGRPPYLICKNAVLSQPIDRFSPNSTCTRRFILFFVSAEKSLCLKFKMAADRHSGFLKIAVIRERIERFSQNLTHTSRKLLLFWGHLKVALLKIQDGGRLPCWICIKGDNLETA